MALLTIDASRTRAALRSLEPAFGPAALVPEVVAAFDALGLGLDHMSKRNLVQRTAPIGPVSVEVAVSVVYNFNPDFIASVIPGVWKIAAPDVILDCQARAYSPVLEAALAPLGTAHVSELASLARIAAEAASERCEGRSLFAGMASQPWPDEDHLVIWNAAKLLREHRGDGHIAGLVIEGLSGIDALVVHAAYEGFPASMIRESRRWSESDWDDAAADLRQRGWLTDDAELVLTEDGRRRRAWIEARTDELAAAAYEPLGETGIDRLMELGAGMIEALAAAGLQYVPPRR
jgi:hypothetical protein